MFSVFKIFNPKNWRKGKVLGRMGSMFKNIPRRSRNAWKAFSKFAKKNKAWFFGIGTAVASAFIVKGLSSLFAKAEQADEMRARRYPSATDDEIAARRRRELTSSIIEHANALKYGREGDFDHIQTHTLGLIDSYHKLLHCFSDPDHLDFGVTADRILGGAACSGAVLEDSSTSPFVVSRFRVEKDDENYASVSEDLKYLLQLDQMNLPLKMQM